MKRRRPPSSSYRRKPVSAAEMGLGFRRDDTKNRFTIEELVAGMAPENEHPLEDDWPVGEELI
jgi:hypothetical protein